jgi:oligoribonuclease
LKNKFVFIDLETTGLDPVYDEILEVGIVIASDEFEIISCFSVQVWSPTARSKLVTNDFVWKMHIKNGLVDACEEKGVPVEVAEEDILRRLDEYSWDPNIPMGGNGVHFDRAFLKVYMPKLHDWFHYRNLDVSPFKQLHAMIQPETLNLGNEDHRALPDAIEDVQQMHGYRTLMEIGFLHYAGNIATLFGGDGGDTA